MPIESLSDSMKSVFETQIDNGTFAVRRPIDACVFAGIE